MKTPGDVAPVAFDKRGEKATGKAAIGQVVDKNFSCCGSGCVRDWVAHFDGTPEEGGAQESTEGQHNQSGLDARSTTTVERHAYAGTDYLQRVIFHEDRLRAFKNTTTRPSVTGGPPVQTGKS